jgi:hypothetical protein
MIIEALNRMRNRLIAVGCCVEAVNELLIKGHWLKAENTEKILRGAPELIGATRAFLWSTSFATPCVSLLQAWQFGHHDDGKCTCQGQAPETPIPITMERNDMIRRNCKATVRLTESEH